MKAANWRAHPTDTLEVVPGGRSIPLHGDTSINAAIATFQDQLEPWESGALRLGAVVRDIRTWSVDLWDRFLLPLWGGRFNRPPILFRFQRESPRVLGHYRRGRNDLGLKYEISVNPRHLASQSVIEVAAVVLHEMLHASEDLAGQSPRSANNYHSIWFRTTATNLGIPCSPYGSQLPPPKESPFLAWALERGLGSWPSWFVDVPALVPSVAVRGESKRTAWVCRCPGPIVHVARATQLYARCEICGSRFQRRG